jgi:hypothetical protein
MSEEEQAMHTQLSAAVAKLETQYNSLRVLCGNMVATLTLEQNQTAMPEMLQGLAAGWREHYLSIVGTRDARRHAGADGTREI